MTDPWDEWLIAVVALDQAMTAARRDLAELQAALTEN